MFGFLKKKIGEFVGAITRREQEKEQQAVEAQPEKTATAVEKTSLPEAVHPAAERGHDAPEEKTEEPEPVEAPGPAVKEAAAVQEELQDRAVPKEPVDAGEEEKSVAAQEQRPGPAKEEISHIPRSVAQPAKEPISEERREEEREIDELVGEDAQARKGEEAAGRIVEEKEKHDVARRVFAERKDEEFLSDDKQRDFRPKVGVVSRLKSFFSGGVEITEAETSGLFRDFELALLESDVSLDTAQALVSELKQRLVGRRVPAGSLHEEVRKEIAFSIASLLKSDGLDLLGAVRGARTAKTTPVKILFVGPNGMGKTTTIAKLAFLLKNEGISSVVSASDTFRAAAIEQAEHHGEKLGIKVVRHAYGADPAAVAFDAIAYAKSHSLDAVLIDTAGRQETNLNLLSEMQKIVRVTKPDYKLFVAEAVAGASLVSQVKTFKEKMGLDGIILTKLDCDAKGGGTLSIAHECGLPVLFVGVGQGYDDLKPFNSDWIVRNVMAE